MKILVALSLALAACAPSVPVISTSPVVYANRTAVDEQVGVGLENGYKAFRLAVELGVDTGLIKGALAARVAAADRRAYAALGVYRSAYQSANSADLLLAARSANIAIEQAIAVARNR